jgi:MYXO-CTERM domain-containing protein
MIRKTQLRAALIVASSSLMLSACVDQESDVAGQQDNTTRESALLSVFSVGPSSQTINEGGTASVGVSLLCSNNLTQDVVITANWGDGTTPEARTIEFGNFGTQGACLAGYVEVCGTSSADADCANWTHTYADGISPTTGTVYPISFTDVQGVDSGGQAVSVNVRNLAPVVSLSRTGADFEGVSADFDLTAEDPGLLNTEIAGVTWTWTPAGNVNDPTVVTCTCANATDCDDGSNLSICNESSGPETDTKLRRYLDDGDYTLTVIVTDKDGGQTTVSKNTTISNLPPENLTVKINNNLISTDSMDPTVLAEGSSQAFLGSLQEPGIDTLDLDWNLGDGTSRPTATGAVTKSSWPNLTNLSPGALAFNYTYDNTAAALSNNYTVVFAADDDDAGTGTRTGFVRVVDVNPVINSFTANGTSGAVSVIEGATVTFAVSAVSGAQDPTFDALTTYGWDIDGNGNGNLANEYTVVGCGTANTTCAVTFLDGAPGVSYDIEVTVNDEDSSTTSPTRTVTVTNQTPNLVAIPALAGILEAGSSSLTYTFTDPAETLDGAYSVSVNWNDGSMPSTASHLAPGTFTIGPHTYADNSLCTNPSAGVCTISVTVCEVLGMICDTETTTIVVTNVVPSPTIAAFPPLEEGYLFDLNGGFTDPANSLDSAYSGEWSGLDFGNQTLPAAYPTRQTDLDVTNGGRFDSQGPKVIQLTVTDGDGGISSPAATANVTVADNTPIITSVVQNFVPVMANLEPARATLDITVKAETASDLLEKVVVNWGDSNIADSEITMGVVGIGTAGTTISVTAPSDYIESGVYTATITVFDEDSSASTTKTITVVNVAPTITLVEATPAAPVIVTEGQSFSARITATDPSTVDAQTLTFQTDWGDTSSDFATGSVTAPGTARAQFSHVYTNPGTYTVTMTVTDPDGGSDVSTLTIEVLNRAPTITDVFNTGPVNENTSVTAVMLVNNPGADTLRYSFNFACTKTDAATVGNSDFTEAIPGMGTSAVRSNTYPNQGSNSVCVRVCDDDGPAFGCDYGLTTVVVNNVAPTITAFPAPAAVNENSAGANVVLSATATDPGPNDTLTYAFDCTSDGTTNFTNTTGTATCVYTGSGNYTATVRVTDGDGGSTFATTQVRVTNLAPAITNVVGLSVNEGDTTTVTITASDIGGGALTYRFDFDNDGTYDVQKATGSANWTYATDGVKTVAVEVCDSNNACDQDSTTLTVSNVAPQIADVSALDINEGGTTTVTIDADDVGGDVLSYRFDFDGVVGTPQSRNSASHTYTQDGLKTVNVTVCDSANACVTSSTTLNVANLAPVITSFPTPAAVNENGAGASVNLTATATDAGGDTLTYAFDCTSDGTDDTSNTTGTATCVYAASGTYTATVHVTDGDGGTAFASIQVRVSNLAAAITDVVALDVNEGDATTVTITAGDAGAGALSYRFDFNNDGSFDVQNATGIATWTYATDGVKTVNVEVCDSNNACDQDSTTLTVSNVAPQIADVSALDINEGGTTTVTIDADDVGGDVLSYRFDFDGVVGTPQSRNSASHTYTQNGLKTVDVQVCDSANACVLGSTTLNVANLAPTITAFATPAAVNESSNGASVDLSATATDAGADTLTYAFDCTSDGTDETSNTTGTATCVYAASGTYTATVHVTDGDGGTAFASTQVRVNNVSPAIATVTGLSVDEGNATTVTITASDAGGDALSYRFDFNNDGQFDVQKATGSATWTYPQDGLKTVGVEVCDNENACAQGTTTLTIANVAPVITSVSTPSSVSRGTAITAIADASDVGNDKLSYLFNFKDSNGTVLFAIGPQASNVAAATISDSGAYSVEVVVTAGAPNVALTATASSNFTVTDISVAVSVVANPSTISEGGSTTITVTTPGGTGPYLVRYDINGDGDFNDAEDIVPADATDTCVTCSETITYADNRTGNLPYRVLVEVTDTGEGNAIATALVSVTVNNVAPTVAAIGDIAAAPEQTAIAVAIVGTDVGASDTLTYSLVSGPSAITVDANTGNLSWTPNWTDEGANSITVRATDNDGGKSEETFTVTVTIIDTNNNNVSDTRERELNNGNLLPNDAGTTDSDNDGVTDLQEVLDGTDPNVSDAPSAPLILSPDKESVDTLRPTLIVVNAESPRGLELQYTFVVEDSTGTEITRISGVTEGVNTTSVEVDVDLSEDAVYTWFANADDGFAVGEDSQNGEFRVNTTNSAPPVPENLTPLDMAILPSGVLAALELRAVVDPDGDAVSYEFEIATDDTFNNLVTTSELRSVPFFTLSEVLAPGEYFWHGRATDGTDASAYGTATFFTIEASVSNVAPPAPTIVKPNGVVLATASATLEITGVVDADGDDVEYIFEIADNAAFAGADTSGLQAELTYAVTGLREDTTYFWRARSSDGSATSEWVSASFAVNAQNSAPTGLAIVSPAPGALLERAPEGLVWAEATDADGDTLTYTVDLATTADFAEILYTEDFAAGDSVAVPTDVTFDPELTYYWRVTVSDGTDSEEVTGSFDLYSAPVVSSGTGGDDGCGCSSVAKPADRQPMALIFGLMMAGLLVMRRRKRD